MPTQISETEEFEFRARAEAEAARPPENKIGGDISRGQVPPEHEELPGFGDAARFVKAIPGGVAQTASDIGTAVAHPIDAVSGLIGKIPGMASTAVNAVAHPIDTTQKVGDYLKNLKPEEAGKSVGGMLTGGAAGKAAGVLGDVVGPSVKALQKPVSPAVRDLAGKGVVMTPGQRGGKLASGLEQRATSIPVLGDTIKDARGKATEQWNRAEINDAIKDAGGKPLPKERSGRDAIFHAEQEMKAAYGRVIPKMKGSLDSAGADGITFRQQISDVVGQNRKLDAEHSKLVHNIIDDDVVAKFKDSGGHASGETLKEIQETLRTEADGLRRGTYQERQAAKAIDDIRTHFMDMLKRDNPKVAPELAKVDQGYAKFKQISQASKYSTKKAGQYTPAQKLRAISAKDKSKDKQRFASGTAHGQKEAESAEKILGNTEPDSGTPGRLMTADLLKHVGTLAASPIYSQWALKKLQNRALKKGGKYTPGTGKKPATVGAILGGQDQQP